MFENVKTQNFNFTGALKKRKITSAIVLHHSDTSADATLESINGYHKKTNGWLGIGYNAAVLADGSIVWCRGLDTVGAQCKGHNEESIGICFIGDFQNNEMPAIQKAAGMKFIADLKAYYPNALVKGHKEMKGASTDCPGMKFPLDEMKNATNVVIQPAQQVTQTQNAVTASYKVQVTVDALNIRAGAGTNTSPAGVIKDKGVYTIVAESKGTGAKMWGKLKSGAGWISLDYVKKV